MVQVCSREEGDTALEGIKERVMEKGASEEVAEQQLSTQVLILHWPFVHCC